MHGFNGRIISIDLGTGQSRIETYDDKFARLYLGGNGLIAKIIHDRVPINADPLGPENIVVFAVGPLNDTPVWGTNRSHMGTISPQTGLFADSDYGGEFGIYQKRTGFDAIVISGRASSPVYLLITEDGATIKGASPFWGKTTEQTIKALQEIEGPDSIGAAIGPAGENGVLYANIICGGKRYGAAGRAGMGAVLGAKSLKAVVVRGAKRTSVADRPGLIALLHERFEVLKKNGAVLKTYGTPFLVSLINTKGMLGTRNNTRETFEHAADICGERIKENYWDGDLACRGCPIACGKRVKVTRGAFAGESVKMPEYETLYAMGSMLENRDIESIFNGNHLCDLMGIDSISMGVTLAFVAECLTAGLVTAEQLGGTVSFRDGEGMVDAIFKTAYRKGIGDWLAEGSAKLANRFGNEAHKFLYTVKGLEIAGHSARGLRMMSLGYPTSTRGGSHHDTRPNYGQADPDPGFTPQPEYVLRSQYFTCIGDSLVLCRFVAERGFAPMLGEPLLRAINLVTGWNCTADELDHIGERIYNLERLINVKRGVRRKDDILPWRVMNEPIPDGPAKGRYCPQAELDVMLDRYYELRGWDSDGVPTEIGRAHV